VWGHAEALRELSGQSKRRVVYVLSSPHSGSTILGIILSDHPDVVFGGELFEIPDPGWDPKRECSCGELVGSCPFWTQVQVRYDPAVAHPLSTRGRPRRWGWNAFLRLLFARPPPPLDIQNYAAAVSALASAVSAVSGRTVVVDTSKDGTRALAYTLDPTESRDVRFIHLVREGGGVVASRKNRELRTSPTARPGLTAVLRYSILWAGANLVFAVVFSIREHRYLRVRYEDLVTHPTATLGRIGEFLELDLTHAVDRIRSNEAFPPGHILSGNRLRLGGGMLVRRDDGASKDPLLPPERQVFSWAAGWAAWLFGYS
jgi:Sulfotransferase family